MKTWTWIFAIIVTPAYTLFLRGLQDSPWSTSKHYVNFKGTPYLIKGVNLHGLETGCKTVDGMWKNPLSFYLDRLSSWGVNAIRVPISFEVMDGLDWLKVNDGCLDADNQYKGWTVGNFIEKLLDQCHNRGLNVLIDRHNIEDKIEPYPFSSAVTENRVIEAWQHFLKRFAKHPAIFAIESQNEPHGDCDLECAFTHANKIIQVAESQGYKGLYLLPGTQFTKSRNDDGAWGGIFNDLLETSTPVFPSLKDRIALSVHIYSYDVRKLVESEEQFERHFGFVSNLNGTVWDGTPVLITEYGGKMAPGSQDMVTYDNLYYYLKKKKMHAGAFMWVMGQSSADTGGIITGDDWRGEDRNKLSYMNLLQPIPSPVYYPGTY